MIFNRLMYWSLSFEKTKKRKNRKLQRLKVCNIRILLSFSVSSIFLSISSRNRCFRSNNDASFWKIKRFRKKMRKHTIRNCWSSLQATLTKLFENFQHEILVFISKVTKSSSYRKKTQLSSWTVVITSNVWVRNCEMQLSHEYQKHNSALHFNRMQKNENARKKSSYFASFS